MKKIKGPGHILNNATEVLSKFTSFTTTFTFSTTIIVAGAFLLSCHRLIDAETDGKTCISIESKSDITVYNGTLDIFVYNLDGINALDSHSRQEFSGSFPHSLEIGTRSGTKKIIVLANWPEDELENWSRISRLDQILMARSELADDNPTRPRMAGTATIRAGERSNVSSVVSMQTLSTKIKIASIACDFSDKTYSGLRMENAKAYLTNVCIATTVSPDDNQICSYMNIGGLSPGDMQSFRKPEYLFREIPGTVGEEKRITDISLFCYPSEQVSSQFGIPELKLVIEGTIDGKTYYYPMRISDFTNGAIRRNTTYIIDIRITKLGGDDSDSPLAAGSFTADVQVLPWRQSEQQIVDF